MHGKFTKKLEVDFAYRQPLDEPGTFPDGFADKVTEAMAILIRRNCGEVCDVKVEASDIVWTDPDTEPKVGYGERIGAVCGVGESACFLTCEDSEGIKGVFVTLSKESI